MMDAAHPSRMKKKIQSPVAACSLGLLVLIGCGKNSQSPPQPPPHPVVAMKAVAKDVPLYLDEIGKCKAYEMVTVLPQVSGPITGIHFTDGSEIKKGDLLFSIDSRPFEADLAKAKAVFEQDQARFTFDVSQLHRNEELRQKQVSAQQELDNARSASAVSNAAMQADLALVQSAQINVDYCSIKSPIDGRAGDHLVDIGNIVNANVTPLLVIQRQDPIYAEFTIPEGDLPGIRDYIKAGTLTVQASFPDDPSKTRTGKFDFVDSGVQADTGTVKMRAVIENADRLFWPGQFVEIRILLDTLKNAVLVPAEAVQTGGKSPFVFVIKPDNTVDLRPVHAGQKQGELMVVTDGLQAGESVVVTGQLALAPGAPVKVVEWRSGE